MRKQQSSYCRSYCRGYQTTSSLLTSVDFFKLDATPRDATPIRQAARRLSKHQREGGKDEVGNQRVLIAPGATL